MKEFKTAPGRTMDDQVVALVDAMRCNEQDTFARLNGVHLIAEYAEYQRRPSYTIELQWTFRMANSYSALLADLQGNPTEYRNLVPRLEALVFELLCELDTLDLHDVPQVAKWLCRLAPATWCPPVLGKNQVHHIVRALESDNGPYYTWGSCRNGIMPTDHERLGVYYVMTAMCMMTYFNLNEVWLMGVKSWLAACRPA